MDDIYREIVYKIKEEIFKNGNRESILKNVARELKIQRSILDNYMYIIQRIIIYSGLVKVCENGQIIMMNDKE